MYIAVESRGASRSLVNEVLEPPRPKDATERSGPGLCNYRKNTRYTKSIFCIQSWRVLARVSHQRCRSRNRDTSGLDVPLSQKSRSHRSMSPIVCSHRAFAQENLALLFWQRRWQLVLACECIFASRKMENLVGRPGFNIDVTYADEVNLDLHTKETKYMVFNNRTVFNMPRFIRNVFQFFILISSTCQSWSCKRFAINISHASLFTSRNFYNCSRTSVNIATNA